LTDLAIAKRQSLRTDLGDTIAAQHISLLDGLRGLAASRFASLAVAQNVVANKAFSRLLGDREPRAVWPSHGIQSHAAFDQHPRLDRGDRVVCRPLDPRPSDFRADLSVGPPIALITMLPISIAGWGVREATMMVAFGYAGLIQSDGTMVSLRTGVISFVVGLLGGLVWVSSSEKPRRISAVANEAVE
jgi:hypothetical protein